MNIKYVSGPILVFRLENNKGHPIYIFGEVHVPLIEQRECHISTDSIRIDQLFKKCFQIHKKIGFFLEMTQNMTSHYNCQYFKTTNQQYIDSLRALVADNISFEPNTNKIIKSETFPNVMFHYFDIRFDIPEFVSLMNRPYLDLANITDNLTELKHNFLKTLHFYKNDHNFQKITKKIYNDNKLKKHILLLQKDILSFSSNLIKQIDTKIRKSKKYYDKYTEKKFISDYNYFEKVLFKSSILFKSLYENIGNYFVIFNDLFLLRRLLDKNYNTDVDYIYCGNHHALNITLFLLKNTDFKITHCTGNKNFIEENYQHYSTKWFIDNIEIISSNTLGYTSYDELNQCVDMSEFPQQLD